MNITTVATMTESARMDAEFARAALHHAALTGSVRGLERLFHNIIEADARLDVVAGLGQRLSRVVTVSDEDIIAWCFGIVAQGSDDTWSGRGNDARRVAGDARRKAATEIVDLIRYA